MNPIPIVLATDNNYVPYCGVAISSLIYNASKDYRYIIYILYDAIASASKDRLEGLSNSIVDVRCVCVKDMIRNLIVNEYGHLTVASAFRILIPELFSQYEKIIYLDSDIIVLDDVSKLYTVDIGDNILGASHALIADGDLYYSKVLNVKKNSYFNAGILIINTSQFVRNNIKDKCLEILKTRSDLQFMDQCALNISCEDRVFFLDKRWNYEWMFLFSNYSDFCELTDPSIIHFDSLEKPWSNPGEKLADYFWKYARMTSFYEEILQRSHLLIIGELLRNIGPECIGKKIVVYGAGYVGQKLVRNIMHTNICNILLWVDRNYHVLSSELMKIERVERIYEVEADYIFIAIMDRNISSSVTNMLVKNGIEERKIKILI